MIRGMFSQLSVVFVFSSLLSAVFLITDPRDNNYDLQYAIPFLIDVVAIFGGLLSALALRSLSAKIWQIGMLGVFSIIVLMGSLAGFAYEVNWKLSDGYFRYALACFTITVVTLCFFNKYTRKNVLIVAKWLLIVATTYMAVLVYLWNLGFDVSINEFNNNLYHEEVGIITTTALLFSNVRNLLIRWATMAFFIVAGVLTHKFTGYFCALITLLVWVLSSLSGNSKVKHYLKYALAIVVGLISMYSAINIALVADGSLPSGNLDARSIMYGIRLKEFADSPIVGSLYMGGILINMPYGNVLSHSDVLDLIAGGGVMLSSLFMIPLAYILININELFSHGWKGKSKCLVLWLTSMFLCLLFTMTFNPILHEPKLNIMFALSCGGTLYYVRYLKNVRKREYCSTYHCS